VEEDGCRAVVKDYSQNGFLFRNLVGRFLVWRETKAYRRLKGLDGVPEFFRVINGLAIVISAVDGVSIEGLENRERLPNTFFRELRKRLAKIHGRGLAHCDLKRAPNILLGRDGKPYIVDWSASITSGECRPFPLNRIYGRFIQDDLNAVVKHQLKHCPESVAPEEIRIYLRRGKVENLLRRLRDAARLLLKKLA
jgi:RIO-like serine/threonine protein kinase